MLTVLEKFGRGFLSSAVHWEVELIPSGPGSAFKEAVRGPGSFRYALAVVPGDKQGSAQVGRKVREALELGLVPILEEGHPHSLDCGIGFVSSLSGIEVSDFSTPEQTLPCALSTARQIPARHNIVVVAPAHRLFLGLSSVLAVDPELNARGMQGKGLTSLFTCLLSCSEEKSLPLLDSRAQSRGAGRIPGLGAGGGAGAMVHAIGGRIIDMDLLLCILLRLSERIADTDLVVVSEARLHSSNLFDSFLGVIYDTVAQHALSVVTIGKESPLSARERTQWGFNGQPTTEGKLSLFRAGVCITQAWGR